MVKNKQVNIFVCSLCLWDDIQDVDCGGVCDEVGKYGNGVGVVENYINEGNVENIVDGESEVEEFVDFGCFFDRVKDGFVLGVNCGNEVVDVGYLDNCE